MGGIRDAPVRYRDGSDANKVQSSALITSTAYRTCILFLNIITIMGKDYCTAAPEFPFYGARILNIIRCLFMNAFCIV